MAQRYPVFVKRLRGLAAEKRLTEKDLLGLGFPGSTVRSWWHGRRRPPPEKLARLAEHLEVDVRYLLGDAMPTALDRYSVREVAARESLRLYLEEDVTVSEEDRKLLGGGVSSVAAPTTIEGWRALRRHFVEGAKLVARTQARALERMGRRKGRGPGGPAAS